MAFALRALRTNGDREGAGGGVSAALRFFPRAIPNRGRTGAGDEMLNRAGGRSRRVDGRTSSCGSGTTSPPSTCYRSAAPSPPLRRRARSGGGPSARTPCKSGLRVCTLGRIRGRVSEGWDGVTRFGKRSREVRDADAPYRASYGRAGAGCRTLVIPPSLPTMRRTAGALRVRAISGIG